MVSVMSMYIRGLIPGNSMELAKAVPIGVSNAHLLFFTFFTCTV